MAVVKRIARAGKRARVRQSCESALLRKLVEGREAVKLFSDVSDVVFCRSTFSRGIGKNLFHLGSKCHERLLRMTGSSHRSGLANEKSSRLVEPSKERTTRSGGTFAAS